jgi:hypothetical protein
VKLKEMKNWSNGVLEHWIIAANRRSTNPSIHQSTNPPQHSITPF